MGKQVTLFDNNIIDDKGASSKDISPEINNHLAKTYTGIYRMHKYWSKKPYNIIRNFIEKYSNKDDIVLDPFCGSGVSVTEAVFAGRKAFGIDINPSAYFITKEMLNDVPTERIIEEFAKIETELKNTINSYYTISHDNKKVIGSHFIWENGNLTEIWYKKRKKRIVTKPTKQDLELSSSFAYEKIPFFYPTNSFFINSRINTKEGMKVNELFTPRNLTGLSLLWNRIEQISEQSIRDFFKFCFTASTGQASKMVFIIKRRGKSEGKSSTFRKEVGSWVIGYWVPKEHFEINVWNCFNSRYNTILKAKKGYEKLNIQLDEAENFNDLLDSSNLLLINEPAQKALKDIPSNSVDYIITDPPHGNRQPYLELSMMWNSWLRAKEIDYENEIVISEAKDRDKKIDNYYKLLDEVLKEIERVLKPGKYFSLMFNSIDDETWANLLITLNKLNFDIDEIETLEYSARSVVQDSRKTGLKTDFILTFKKNPEKVVYEIEFVSVKENKEIFKSKIQNYIKNSINGLETYKIFNLLVHDYLKNNQFFKLSEISELLKKEFDNKKGKWV